MTCATASTHWIFHGWWESQAKRDFLRVQVMRQNSVLIKSVSLCSLLAFLTKQKLLDEVLVKSWEEALPITFYYDHLSEDEKNEINADIYKFYFKEQFLGVNEKNLTHVGRCISIS
jgi:hypothetical protein